MKGDSRGMDMGERSPTHGSWQQKGTWSLLGDTLLTEPGSDLTQEAAWDLSLQMEVSQDPESQGHAT